MKQPWGQSHFQGCCITKSTSKLGCLKHSVRKCTYNSEACRQKNAKCINRGKMCSNHENITALTGNDRKWGVFERIGICWWSNWSSCFCSSVQSVIRCYCWDTTRACCYLTHTHANKCTDYILHLNIHISDPPKGQRDSNILLGYAN